MIGNIILAVWLLGWVASIRPLALAIARALASSPWPAFWVGLVATCGGGLWPLALPLYASWGLTTGRLFRLSSLEHDLELAQAKAELAKAQAKADLAATQRQQDELLIASVTEEELRERAADRYRFERHSSDKELREMIKRSDGKREPLIELAFRRANGKMSDAHIVDVG